MSDVFQVIHNAFHVRSSPLYTRIERLVWAVIVLSILMLVLDVARWVPTSLVQVFDWTETGVVIFFAIELVLRVGSFQPPELDFYELAAPGRLRAHVVGRLRFCLRPMIIIDIITVLGSVPVLRGLRAFRLLRLVRSKRLFRYSNPFRGIARAFEENALMYAFGLSVLTTAVVIGGLSFYLSEHQVNPTINTLSDAMWWSIVTITTVGYGDLTPMTGVGKVVAAALMISGMITLALFAGIVGSSLMNSVLSMREESFRMSNTIGHIIICGYSPGARMLLDTVSEEIDLDQHEVVIFAPDPRPADVSPEFGWIQGDPTKESELEKARLGHAAAAIIVGGRGELPQQADARTILTAFTVRRFLRRDPALAARRNNPLYIVAEILDAENVEHVRTAGADEVIETTRLGFSLLSHAVEVHGTATILGELADVSGNSLFVGCMPTDLTQPMTFASVGHDLKVRFGVLVVGVRELDGSDTLNPHDDTSLSVGHGVIYMAKSAYLPAM